MQQKNIIVDKLKINYLVSDRINPEKVLVFLHGWQSEGLHFKVILDNCESYLALDLPGFGKSEQPLTAWSLRDYADFLKKFLEKAGIRNPILIGHSFGGSIIIKYCFLGYPAQKIILVDSAGIRESGFKITLYKYIAKIFKVVLALPGIKLFRQKIREKAYQTIDSEDYLSAGSMVEIYRKTIREDLQKALPGVRPETILIWGKDDRVTPLRNAEKMKQLIPNCQLFVIENAGHFPFIDKPEEFRKILRKELLSHTINKD